ncbi:HD domain-containing protein [Alkaliphilus crotonatoxidans]
MIVEKAIEEMKSVFKEIPYGIDHTLKVLENARLIMADELIDQDQRQIVELAAVLHDIGAVEAQRKYGSLEGKFQEQEGPGVAREILNKIACPRRHWERICFIIGHHHTPAKIDGIDFQILWEADLLENLAAMDLYQEQEKIKEIIDNSFQTQRGTLLAKERLLVNSNK